MVKDSKKHIRQLVLTIIVTMSMFSPSWAGTECSTHSVGQISDIVYNGESKNSDPGTVSDGTIIIDSRDLKRKQCDNGNWRTLTYDGKNATSIDPWIASKSEYMPLNAQKRTALSSIGRVDCGNTSGTGFLLDLSAYGAKENRDYDVILTSCHVIKGSTCKFHARNAFRSLEPQTALNNNIYETIYSSEPYNISLSESDTACTDIFNGKVSKKDARKDWVFMKLDRKVDHIAEQDRIKLEQYNSNKIERISDQGELYVIGAPPQEVVYRNRTFAIFDVVYSKECKARVQSNNILHTCISFPGMSGGPTGYFAADNEFIAVGINSWSSEMQQPLHKKKAEQIQRGAATAVDEKLINALKSFIRELE